MRIARNVTVALGALSALVLSATGSAWAEEVPVISNLTANGGGCQEGTVSSAVAPDGSLLTIFFDDYVAETEGRQKFAQSACDLGLHIAIPDGHRITSLGVDFRGYAFIPKGGKGKFRAQYKLNRKGAGNHQTNFGSGHDDDFFASHEFSHPPNANKFKCGEDAQLSIGTSLRVQKKNPKQEDEAFAALDSADVAPGIEIVVNTAPCR